LSCSIKVAGCHQHRNPTPSRSSGRALAKCTWMGQAPVGDNSHRGLGGFVLQGVLRFAQDDTFVFGYAWGCGQEPQKSGSPSAGSGQAFAVLRMTSLGCVRNLSHPWRMPPGENSGDRWKVPHQHRNPASSRSSGQALAKCARMGQAPVGENSRRGLGGLMLQGVLRFAQDDTFVFGCDAWGCGQEQQKSMSPSASSEQAFDSVRLAPQCAQDDIFVFGWDGSVVQRFQLLR